MKKTIFAGAALALATVSAPAMAQDASQAEFYIGAQAGYHDVGANAFGDDDGAIFGGYAGVDVPVGESLVLGVEGNYNIGTGAIDSEYGVVGKIGIRTGGSREGQLFVRGGYQEVDFDLNNIVGGPVPAGLDDTEGDYMVGIGAQMMVSQNVSLRAVVDTIAFDSLRATAGLALHF